MMRYAVGSAVQGRVSWRPPVPRSEGALRVVTLNIAHGRRSSAHQALLRRETLLRNLETIASSLRGLGADAVALQEADGPSRWSGNLDHVARLALLSGFDSHFRGDHNPFGSASLPLRSGTALLARHELVDQSSAAFGTSWRDTKGFVIAAVEVPGWQTAVDLVSVHLDPLVPQRRHDQISQLGDYLSARADRPRILLGDLNCCGLLDPEAHQLLERLGLHTVEPSGGHPTYPSMRPRLRFDWVFASKELEFRNYQTLARPLSDHLGIVADLALRS